MAFLRGEDEANPASPQSLAGPSSRQSVRPSGRTNTTGPGKDLTERDSFVRIVVDIGRGRDLVPTGGDFHA